MMHRLGLESFRKSAFFSVALLLVAACSTGEKQAPQIQREPPAQVGNAQERKEVQEAVNLYRAKKHKQALSKFNAYITKHPETDLAQEAHYYVGQIHFDGGDSQKALKAWTIITSSRTESPFYDRALYGNAVIYNQSGKQTEALSELNKFNYRNTDKALAGNAAELSSRLKLAKGDGVGALFDLQKVAELKPSEVGRIQTRSREIVQTQLNTKQLEEVVGRSDLAAYEPAARFKLAMGYYDQRDWNESRSRFSDLIAKFPNSEEAQRAQQYLTSTTETTSADGTVIGAVLPLTGKYAQMGYKTLRGIQLGLGTFNRQITSPVKLAVIDSEGNADIARRGVDRLVREDKAVAIIGSLLSKEAMAVASRAQELGVPAISLSQKSGLNDVGDYIFRNTLTPEIQLSQLVDIAINQRGYKKFAILYPNDAYGTEYATVFWDMVLSRGGRVTAAQTYSPDETDFRGVVKRLAGTFYVEGDRGKELKMRLDAWQKDQAAKNSKQKPPEDILPPVVDFDAIFIPDSPKVVGQISGMLAYCDVDKVPLLGTNLWNTQQIVERGGKYLENALFVDTYFPEDKGLAMQRFVADFQEVFNYKPDVFEAQGFDSAALLMKTLRTSGFSLSRQGLRERLAQATDVPGATGPFRISARREIDKTLIPLTVSKGQIVKAETGASTSN